MSFGFFLCSLPIAYCVLLIAYGQFSLQAAMVDEKELRSCDLSSVVPLI